MTLAGLVDGVNPCAFATVVFMVIYLAGLGINKREVLAAGLAFSAAVFLAYFGLEAGALSAVAFVSGVPHVRVCVLLAGVVSALVFGLLSFRDYLVSASRIGGLKAGVLRLSDQAAARVKITIAKFARSRWVIAGAFGAGFTVSLVEVVCTGQVYLPTIIFVSQESGTRPAGLGALLLYNLAFIIPMLLVFLAVLLGMTTGAVTRMTQRHLAKAKLALAVVFLGLATVLTAMAIP